VTLATQLDPRAQSEAKMVCGFDEDHSSILVSKQVATHFSTVINSHRNGNDTEAGDSSGMLKVHFSSAAPSARQSGWPVLYLSPAERGKASGDGIIINLRATDNGRSIGPVPAGDYHVSLFADAFRAEPVRQVVKLGPRETAAVEFTLIPAGMVSGFIQKKFYDDGDPAGIYMHPDTDLTLRSIRLSGEGLSRVLVPEKNKRFNPFDHYQSGKDWANNAVFAFYNVPQGTYRVTIDAEGYERYTEQRIVVPGQTNGVKGIELSPLK
jgi:hypothetical protein